MLVITVRNFNVRSGVKYPQGISKYDAHEEKENDPQEKVRTLSNRPVHG